MVFFTFNVFFLTSNLLSEKDPGIFRIVSQNLKSLNHQKLVKTEKLKKKIKDKAIPGILFYHV